MDASLRWHDGYGRELGRNSSSNVLENPLSYTIPSVPYFAAWLFEIVGLMPPFVTRHGCSEKKTRDPLTFE